MSTEADKNRWRDLRKREKEEEFKREDKKKQQTKIGAVVKMGI